MIADLPDQIDACPQSLFCRSSGVSMVRPAIADNVRERFARFFAADFAAAMTEHRHDDEHDRPVQAA